MGLCIALGDALSLGISSIGFKSCTGVNELIKDNYNRYLEDDGI